MNLRKCDVFLDICTQRDYLALEGAHPSLNARPVLPNLKHLMAFARWARVPTLSCVDARRPDDVRGTPRPSCVIGTAGQLKLGCTLLPERTMVQSDNCLCISLELLQTYQQAIFTKHHKDPFTNPKLDRLLTEMPARRFVVFGVGLESSLRALVLGLMLRGRRAALVYDACGHWNQPDAEMSLRQLGAKGCEILSTQQFLSAGVANGRRSEITENDDRRVA